MVDPKKIAILLTAYNGINFLKEQLDSIQEQRGVIVSIYLSVDLSTDKTYEFCQYYAESYDNITILPYGERFGGAAPNFFRLIRDVDFSQFDYVAFSDQDDVWFNDKLHHACQELERKGADGYSANVIAYWSDGREHVTNKAQAQRKYDYLFEAAGPGCTYTMRVAPLLEFKQLLISNRQKTSQIDLHDWFVYAFFRSNGYQWFIDPIPKMRYRQHEHNQVGLNNGWRAIYKRLALLKRAWYSEQVDLISSLVMPESTIHKSKWNLLKHCNQLRRKPVDRFILFVFVLLGAFN